MNRPTFILLILFILFLAPAVYAGESLNHGISSEVFGGGGGDMTSANHWLHGKTRGIGYGVRTSGNYRLGEGFLHSSYYALALQPLITSITPDHGSNDSSIPVTIFGSGFLPGAIVFLVRTGSAPITGEGVVVADPGRIECTFNLVGKKPGSWSLEVINPDGKAAILPNAFNVTLPGGRVDIKGSPINYPNPFDPDKGPTKIKFELTKDAAIDIYIFNIYGTRIWQDHYDPGTMGGKFGVNEVLWDGINAFSENQPNGIYVYQISSGGRTLATGKIAIFR